MYTLPSDQKGLRGKFLALLPSVERLHHVWLPDEILGKI